VALNPTGGVENTSTGLALDFIGEGSLLTIGSTGAVTFLPVGSTGQVLTVSSTSSTDLAWETPSGGGGSTFFVEAGNSGISTSTVGTSTFVYNTSTGAGVYLPLAGGTMTGAIDFGQLVFTYFIEPTTSFPDSGFSGSGEWGTVFDFNSAGFVKGGAFYKQIGNTGTHSLSMWNYDTSAFLASTLFTGETAAGWQTQNFTTPIPVVPGVNYMIAYGSSTGHNSQASGFFAPSTSPNGYINIKTHGSGGESGFNGTIGNVPTAGAPNDYGVDVLFELTSTGTQASITADGSGDLILNGTSVELSTSMFLNGNTLVLDSTNSNLVGDGFGDLFISANNTIALEATAIILQGTVLLEEVILDVATLAVPSITKGAALGGTGATASFQGTEFFDNAGTIRLKPGLLTSTGILATVTFGVGFPFGAFFTLSPANALAAGLGTTTQVFISAASATQFVITSGSAPLAVGSTYEFTYVGIGF
jgi:hypothetical protein